MQIPAQSLRFSIFQGISVNQNGQNLSFPWAGGMNSMQYQSMDLNGDGVMDLICFDRTSNQVSTFLQDSQGNFSFAPGYALKFPAIENWFAMADFNQDGRKDLFCSSAAGIKVYQNKSLNGQIYFEKVKDPLYTKGFSGLINLYVASPDIPVIADVDSDGDVDVLAFEPGGHYIEFHENVSMQKSGKADLDFEKSPQYWGNFVHHDCRDAQILNSEIRAQAVGAVNRVDHVGNSLGRTANNDLFFGQVACTNLGLLKNVGTQQQVSYSNIDFDYLSGLSVGAGVFYSATPLQLNGKTEELFVSFNTPDNAGFRQDFQHTSFRIVGGKAKPFLQDQMIDVGEKASPCFFDVDDDGDLDLLVGHAGYRVANDVKSSIFLYENISGTFQFKTADYLGLSASESLTDLVLQVQGNHMLVVGQSSEGSKVFYLAKQQITKVPLVVNSGELPCMSPWGNLIITRTGRIQSVSNTDWGQLSKESWQLRSCQFADMDGDGTAEFIGIDLEGNWHIGNYDVLTNLISWRSADFQGFTVGRNARLSVADFNADGRHDLVVGAGAGGIYLLENKSNSPVWDAMTEQTIQVWPNPHLGQIHVLTSQPGELQLYNMMGQKASTLHVEPGITYDLNVKQLGFIRFVDVKGRVSTQKLQQD